MDDAKIDQGMFLPFTSKREERLDEVMKGLRAKAVARREVLEKSPPVPSVQPQPRYDEVYFDGLKWLDSLAGEPLPEKELEIRMEVPVG